MKRYTYQDVKNIVEEAGYKLLSTEKEIVNDKGFVLTTIKIKTKCPNNHIYDIMFGNFVHKGNRCKKCQDNKRKLTYEEVKEYIESFGYKLLSKEYISSSEKLKIKCPQGHIYDVKFNNFKNGNRCPECQRIYRYTFDDIKEIVENKGYKLLSKEYVNNNTKLSFLCPNGHEYETIFSCFQQGHRCPECAKEYYGDYCKLKYEDVKEYIESFGYKLLSEAYVNNNTKLIICCPNGHNYHVRYANFKQGNRCPYCKRIDYKEVKMEVEKFGYKLLSTFNDIAEKLNGTVGISTNIKVKCPNPNHEIYEVKLSKFINRKDRCPYCNVSKGEQKIMDWLNKNEIQYIYDKPYFKDLLSPSNNLLRPDFILPDYKIWIEYDGEFHYKKMYEDDSFEIMLEHDKIKNIYAENAGWKLIRIPYWDFDNIEEILKCELNLK